MPKISKMYTLEITPEQFLDNCSALELNEIRMLIQSPRYNKQPEHYEVMENKLLNQNKTKS